MAGLTFEKDETVLCFHGPLAYEAKILKAEMWETGDKGTDGGPHYYIHYKGWKASWDEWVPESRVLKHTPENIRRQRDLQIAYTQSKDAASKKNDATKKRPRDSVDKEEEYLRRPEVKIPLPDSLKAQLVDEWENITKHQRLVALPRNPNVAQLLEEYRVVKTKGKQPSKANILNEVLDGLKLYFDKSLGTILLYRFERLQYAEALKRFPGQPMSEVYGAEHLLRLFVQLPMLIAHTTMDMESVAILKDELNQLLTFIQKNADRYFVKEYENASPDYVAIQQAS